MELIINWMESAAAAVGLKSWALTVFLIVLISLLLDFIQRRGMKHLGQVAIKTENLWDDALHHAVSRP